MARVVLLHGVGKSGRAMARLERAVADAGYATLNVNYPSRHHRLETLVEDVHETAREFVSGGGPVHFVCHSMGGLVARGYIGRYRPAALGRVVMLGTPNQGSELADLLGWNPVYKLAFGPAGQQLRTRPDAATRTLLGAVDYPVGVVAGDRPFDVFGWLYLPKPNDGRVSVAATKVPGMAGHITLPVDHEELMRDGEVHRQVLAFLRDGSFEE
jgi:pimeloyl-ACP methyl ester carboxylesterase